MSYITLCLPFNIDGEKAKRLVSTAWLFKVASNRMLSLAMKTPLYSIKVDYVDPRGTTRSREHDMVMKKYRLDKHTASAYLIALRGIKGYKMIQKAID